MNSLLGNIYIHSLQLSCVLQIANLSLLNYQSYFRRLKKDSQFLENAGVTITTHYTNQLLLTL